MNEVPGRLLREALESGMPGESADCLDIETLAAWADNMLSRRERGAAEAHAAGCARCQAMIAVMARTAPPAVSRVWWRSPLGWIVPLTAAAAALLVWFELPQSARAPAPQSASATVSVASPSPSAPTPPQSRDERVARADEDKNKDLKIETDKAIASPRQEKVEKEVFDKVAKSSEPKPDAAPVDQAPAPASREAAAGAAAAAPPPPTTPPAAAPPPARAPAAPPRLASSPEAQKFALKDESASQARNALDLRRQAPEIVIPSPNANSRWRITAAGVVQHSTDGGSTWETQATGSPTTPTAGMSPSASVCWLVGPRGLVLLSTDGRSWKRIVFPEMVDLTAVRAADDKTATVTTSDGRTFTTSDGGNTWR